MIGEASEPALSPAGSIEVASIRDYISLCKPRILALLVVVAVVTATVAAGPSVPWLRVALVAVAGVMASASASIMNNYMDRDIDAVMSRTRNRPMARGIIPAWKALSVAVGMLIVAVAISLLLSYLTAIFVLLGATVYALVYTWWLKRRTPVNIVVGGLAGSCAALAGWAAVATQLSAAPLVIAVILFLWTPSHFWSFALVHSESYREANIPMLPLVASRQATARYIMLHSALMVASSIALFFFSQLGPVYLAGALLFGGLFLGSNLLLWRRHERKTAWASYKFSGLYLLGLFAFMLIDVLI
ncbi:MAG: protoheme IX farnesyltransferase [Chloroflexi bacterium]|nr:protoheme IX farnesyltransferase [Chloroflexota bacterium]